MKEIIKALMKKCCDDNCEHYNWYYDYCDVWKCEVDGRSCCSEYSQRERKEVKDDYKNV